MLNYADNLLLSSANKVEELLSLETQYGPLSGYTPAINTVLNYLQQVYDVGIITCIPHSSQVYYYQFKCKIIMAVS